jgi:hypothetical protein
MSSSKGLCLKSQCGSKGLQQSAANQGVREGWCPAGCSKECIICTLVRMQQLVAACMLPHDQPLTADAAMAFSGGAQATHAHKHACTFSRCTDCQKGFSNRRDLDSRSLHDGKQGSVPIQRAKPPPLKFTSRRVPTVSGWVEM